jgi:hypothetical protein
MSAIRYGSLSHVRWAEADIERLRRLVAPIQPMACVYVAGRRRGVDADEDLQLRIRSLVRELEADGVDEPTAAAVRSYAGSLGPDYEPHAILARDGVVLYKQTLAGAPPLDLARFAAPPVVTPVLRWLYARPPHVVVIVDRSGAEITATGGGGGPQFASTVVGPDDEITPVVRRGGSQPRHQRRVEDAWRHNASAVVDAALLAAEQVGAGLILVAGDARAVALVRDGLHDQPAEVRVRGLATTRRSGLSAAVAAAVADDTNTRIEDVLQRLCEGGGPRSGAVEGAAETFAALAAGRVDVLVVVDGPADGRLAWCGSDLLCSLARPEWTDRVVHGRMVDVAVRAALLTDAHVCVVPGGHPLEPAEGIGALVRYPLRWG